MAGSLCLEYEYIHHNQQVTHDRKAALLARYNDLEITGSRHQRRGLRSVTVKPGKVINDIFSHEDWMPTLMAAVGEPDIKKCMVCPWNARLQLGCWQQNVCVNVSGLLTARHAPGLDGIRAHRSS